MDDRQWPDYSHPPPDEADGWLVAGPAPSGWAFSTGNGHRDPSVPPGHVSADGGWPDGGYREPPEPDRWPQPQPARWYDQPPDPYPAGSGYPGYPPTAGYPEPEPYRPPQPGSYYPGADAPTTYFAAVGADRPPARQPSPGTTSAYHDPVEDDDPVGPGWLAVVLWTSGAFLLPILVYLLWASSLSATPPVGCVEATGDACASARADAVGKLVSVLPWLVLAWAIALVVASTLRRLAGWRGSTVAFAGSVIGAGLTTLVASALG